MDLWMCLWMSILTRLIAAGRASCLLWWHHSLGQDPGLYKDEKMSRADAFIALCFLIVDVVEPEASAPAAVTSLPWWISLPNENQNKLPASQVLSWHLMTVTDKLSQWVISKELCWRSDLDLSYFGWVCSWNSEGETGHVEKQLEEKGRLDNLAFAFSKMMKIKLPWKVQ